MALSGEGLRVLLVEDDKTCMFVTETMLKKFKYEVVAHRNPIEALKELREKNGEFDIVLTDIHMPAMNGLDLLAEIKKDYIKLPVVLMSVDGERDVIIDGINRGAALYFMKPLGMSQIKNLWQHTIEVVYPNKVIESLENALTLEDEDSSPEGVTDEEEDDSGSTNDEVNLEGKENDDQENEESVDETEEQKDDETAAQKKQRMMWSPELHNKFLDAIESIGEEHVVPKRILEVMNVPGLTRENVASHLQKYRIYVNKIKEEDRNIERSRVRSMAQSALGTPAFASNYPTALPNIQQALPQFSQPAQNVQSSILRDEYFQGSEVVPPLDQPNSTNNFRRHESSRTAADGETQSLNNAVLQGIHNLTCDVPTMQQTVPQQNDNGSSYDDLSYQLQQLSSINTNNFDGSSRMINPNPNSSGSLYTGPMPGDQSSNIPNTNINYIDRHVSARVGGVREPQVVSAPHETAIFSSDFNSQNEGYGDGFSDSNQFFQLPPFNNVATQPLSSNHSLPPLPQSMPPLPSMVPLPPLSPLPPLPQQLELPTEQNGDGLLDELFNLEGFNTNAGTNLLPLLLDNDFDDTLFRNQDFPPPW